MIIVRRAIRAGATVIEAPVPPLFHARVAAH
jgi:hypothetical protein